MRTLVAMLIGLFMTVGSAMAFQYCENVDIAQTGFIVDASIGESQSCKFYPAKPHVLNCKDAFVVWIAEQQQINKAIFDGPVHYSECKFIQVTPYSFPEYETQALLNAVRDHIARSE